MADPRRPLPALLVIAAFSRHPQALLAAQQRLEALYGPVALTSPDYEFHHTTYYEATMGPNLKKRFLVFDRLIALDALASVKLQTNALEAEVTSSGDYPELRPLNLDPGLLQLGKFMLATMKDKDHRIYLRDGVYAEVTLRFTAGGFEAWPWTYRDYQEEFIRGFLDKAREYYRQQLALFSEK